MKKIIIKLVAVVLFVSCMSGCSSKSKNTLYEGRNTVGYGHMYDRIPDSNEFYTSEEMNYIQKDIASWAKSNLLFDCTQKDSLEAKTLNSLIVDTDERNKIQEDCNNTNSIQISDVQVELQKAVRTKYQDKEVGKVNCTIKFSGERNGETLDRTYTLVLLIHYADKQTAIYEIGEIDFVDAEA